MFTNFMNPIIEKYGIGNATRIFNILSKEKHSYIDKVDKLYNSNLDLSIGETVMLVDRVLTPIEILKGEKELWNAKARTTSIGIVVETKGGRKYALK